MSSGVNRTMVGSVIGTGSAINVKTVGFKPKMVELYNVTGNANAIWIDRMADASAQKMVDSGAGETDLSLITSNGITPLSNGFTIGTDADINAAAEVIHWVAFE